MKKFENVCMFVVVALLSLTMYSCGDDDEVGNADDLIGAWSVLQDEGYEIYDGKSHPWNETNAEGEALLVFNSDHTLGGISDEGVWSYKGNKITFDFTEENPSEVSTEVWTVLELTSTKLVMEFYEKEDGDEYYNKLTCKKR